MKIAISSDHAGYNLKQTILQYVKQQLNYEISDMGPYSNASVDYPTYAKKVAEAVSRNNFNFGILICGTGVGISISANKVNGIRCALCNDPYTAMLSRMHNDSNVLAIGARIVADDLAKHIIKTWLQTPFEDDSRHKNRIKMIHSIEETV